MRGHLERGRRRSEGRGFGAQWISCPSSRETSNESGTKVPVQSVVDDSMASTSFTVILLGIAAGVALLLGTVGIYGVVAYIVSRRTQEIGVRMALGAPASVVVGSFLRQGLVLTGLGVGLGLLGSWAMSRALASLLYGVEATDPLTFIGTAGLLALVSTLATWIPARRASRINPVEALRSE